ncbi:MAG: hydroxyacid dehydrogenase [Candidatus Hydrogenedentes bacterium]|nr:hydroxyacid dehydrogenase [Candidatus Hydrogenedentota bacterium]
MPGPKTAILLTRSMQARCFAEADLRRIATFAELSLADRDEISGDVQRSAMGGAEIIVTGWGTLPISPALLDAAPNLRLMCHAAGSVKHLVNDEFRRRRIRVCSAASALAVGVAEFAFGMMLVTMKAVWQFRSLTAQGRWGREQPIDWVREPYEATVGIIGASFVGREMIRLCRQLSLKAMLLYDPYVSADEAAAIGARKVELDELMRRSDVVSLHAPATDETQRMVNARNLALLKDRAIIINTARGACVDEPALISELQSGRIFACLDVTDPEPPAPGSPLYNLPNCVLTPHIAGAIKENTFRQGKLVADQIESYVQGGRLPGEVNLEQLRRLA